MTAAIGKAMLDITLIGLFPPDQVVCALLGGGDGDWYIPSESAALIGRDLVTNGAWPLLNGAWLHAIRRRFLPPLTAPRLDLERRGRR